MDGWMGGKGDAAVREGGDSMIHQRQQRGGDNTTHSPYKENNCNETVA